MCRNCDFTHLWQQISQLVSFSDFKQYGQLAAKLAGVLVGDFGLFGVVMDGFQGTNGYGFYDSGHSIGYISSQLLDASL